MTLARRLERIESRLTPRQAVLLWLKEAQEEFEDFRQYQAVLAEAPRSADPLIQIPNRVAKAVRESLKYSREEEEIARFELGARRQTSFLFALLLILNRQLVVNGPGDCLWINLLEEQTLRMGLQWRDHDRIDREKWKLWRENLIALRCDLWRLKATVEAVSLRYFGGSQILFSKQEWDLNERIARTEFLAQLYNMNKRLARSLAGGINLAALRRSTEREVPDARDGRGERAASQ